MMFCSDEMISFRHGSKRGVRLAAEYNTHFEIGQPIHDCTQGRQGSFQGCFMHNSNEIFHGHIEKQILQEQNDSQNHVFQSSGHIKPPSPPLCKPSSVKNGNSSKSGNNGHGWKARDLYQ